MAWQNSVAMAGNGGVSSGSSEIGGSNGQQHGTEYTLQGTVLFADSRAPTVQQAGYHATTSSQCAM